MKATKENVWDSIPVNILKHKEQAINKPRIAIIGKSKVENSQNGEQEAWREQPGGFQLA